jgi:hypothetical protein
MADIFVSYTREDEPRVRHLVSAFEARGWSVFWDRHIPAGSTWRSHIGAALDAARCIVVFWSPHSVASDWVSEEADEGKRRGILIPVLVDGAMPPRGFREVQAADLGAWQPGAAGDGVDRLCADVARLLSRATITEPPQPVQPLGVPTAAIPPGSSRPAGFLSSRAWLVGGATVAAVALAGISYVGMRGDREKPAIPSAEASRRDSAPAPAPRPATAQWLVIAGSYTADDIRAAQRRRQILVNARHDAATVTTSDYPGLQPGLVAVVVGPFETRAEADAVLARVRQTVPDAYVKRGR